MRVHVAVIIWPDGWRDVYLVIPLIVDHDMKPRTVLAAIALTAMPLLMATSAQAAEPGPREETGLDILSDLLKEGPDKDIKTANEGSVGPGLSELVAIAEGILRKYGITKSFADVMDPDAGILAIASGILNVNGKEGNIAAPGKLLGNSPPGAPNTVCTAPGDAMCH